MTITEANLTGNSDGDPGFTRTTASITPTANRLVLLAFFNNANSGSAGGDPTVAGNGLTWVQVVRIDFSTRTLFLYRALGASPSTGSITIDFPEQSLLTRWSVSEYAGIDTSGTNGSGAIVQSATASIGTTNTPSVTLATFASATNATFGAFGNNGAFVDMVPGSGFTEVHDFNAGVGTNIATEWRNDADTSVDGDWSAFGPTGGCGIAVEIAEAAVAGIAPRQPIMVRQAVQRATVR